MRKYFWCLFVLFLLSSLGISGNAHLLESSQQSDPDSQERSSQFMPDGVISEGEYENQVTYQNLEIFWSNDQEYIYMALKGKTQGYISIGIQPDVMMKDSDMIFGFVKDGKTEIFDQYSTGNFGPHPSDKKMGGTDDILEYGGKEAEGFTVIEFKRLLKTGDQYDLALVPGKNKIIWGYSDQDSMEEKHSKRGYGEIEIKIEK